MTSASLPATSWVALCERLRLERAQCEAWWSKLHAAYEGDGRYYHTLEHLSELLQHARAHAVERGVLGRQPERHRVPIADHHLGRAAHRARDARRARAASHLEHALAAHVNVRPADARGARDA